jgi:hypothetical protein
MAALNVAAGTTVPRKKDGKMKTIVELGYGTVSIDKGTFGGVPAVFIEPVNPAGVLGEKGPDLPLNSLRPGAVILEIHNQRGADVLADNLAPKMREALMKLAGWFEALQGTDTNDPLWMMRQRAHEVPRKIIADALYPTE